MRAGHRRAAFVFIVTVVFSCCREREEGREERGRVRKERRGEKKEEKEEGRGSGGKG